MAPDHAEQGYKPIPKHMIRPDIRIHKIWMLDIMPNKGSVTNRKTSGLTARERQSHCRKKAFGYQSHDNAKREQKGIAQSNSHDRDNREKYDSGA
jgi:hypothetical protein